jgi:hypothetical protein
MNKKGFVGMKLGPGEVVLTSSGRPTTPFPKWKKVTGQLLRKVDAWLLENAILESQARNDKFCETIFKGENSKNLPRASKDSMEEYLFGE